uniref:Uncharacterized protein n=1 Tax=Mycena chlorophos TaxID=658473 RepID=A0ABQ0LZZ7_MYCCL|nr:predicted protein [Mycena chlorophos]
MSRLVRGRPPARLIHSSTPHRVDPQPGNESLDFLYGSSTQSRRRPPGHKYKLSDPTFSARRPPKRSPAKQAGDVIYAYDKKPKASVVALHHLPPFLRLSDLHRIALHAGAPARDILGIKLHYRGGNTSRDPLLTGEIHFREAEQMTAFLNTPLVLRIQANPRRVFPVSAIEAHLRQRQVLDDAQANTPAPEDAERQGPPHASTEPTSYEFVAVRVEGAKTLRFIDQRTGVRSRWLSLHVYGSGFVRFTPQMVAGWEKRPEQPAREPQEEEENSNPTKRYAKALKDALAREQQLEEQLSLAGKEALDAALKNAHVVAEAQIRADCGEHGTIEGIWLRGVPVVRDGNVFYDLHAQVAFANFADAELAFRLLPLQHGRIYGHGRMQLGAEPWPEALGQPRPESVEVLGASAVDGPREGWARQITGLLLDSRAALKSRKERDEQRDQAAGTWGKETLQEIRQRLKLR